MFRPGRILQIGGASNGAVVIDITGGTPVVTPTQSMSSQRRWSTRRCCRRQGARHRRQRGLEPADRRQHSAEIWNPATGQWTLGAAGALARLYHSTALLLPDASVLVAGGGAPGTADQPQRRDLLPAVPVRRRWRVAARPSIAQAPECWTSARDFALDVTAAASISRVDAGQDRLDDAQLQHGAALPRARLQRQRRQPVGAGAGAPDDAPPGTYLLFVIDAAGVPSVGRIVRIDRRTSPWPTRPRR